MDYPVKGLISVEKRISTEIKPLREHLSYFFLNKERMKSNTTEPMVPTRSCPQKLPLEERPSKLKIQLPNTPPTRPTRMHTRRLMPFFIMIPARRPASAPMSKEIKIPICLVV